MGAPPAAITPTRANWLAPVKTRNDRAQVWATDSPDATETAPKPTPYAPVATPTPRLSRMIDDRSRGSSGASVTPQRLVPPAQCRRTRTARWWWKSWSRT